MFERKTAETVDFMKRYPCVTAHIIAESLGYAPPSRAARILKDAMQGRPNHCEWVDACWGGDALAVVKQSIRCRHNHHGYMSEYKYARHLVKVAVEKGTEPDFASWF